MLTKATNKGGSKYICYGIDRRMEIYEITIDGNETEAQKMALSVKDDAFYYVTNFSQGKKELDKDTKVTLYCSTHQKSLVSTFFTQGVLSVHITNIQYPQQKGLITASQPAWERLCALSHRLGAISH